MMSDYGADPDPDLIKATDLAYTKGFLPLDKSNVMQWTYPDDVVVRKLANKQDKSNVLFKEGPPPPPPVIPPDLDPVAAGNTCFLCWGNGRPFGVGETPITVTVVVQNVEKGSAWVPPFGEPPEGTFELTQVIGIACNYNFEDDDFVIDYSLGPPFGTILIRNKPTMIPSFGGSKTLCTTFFENEFLNPFMGGTATIFIPPII